MGDAHQNPREGLALHANVEEGEEEIERDIMVELDAASRLRPKAAAEAARADDGSCPTTPAIWNRERERELGGETKTRGTSGPLIGGVSWLVSKG